MMSSLDMVEGGKELCANTEPDGSSSIVAIIFTAGVAIGVVIGVIVGCVLVKFFTVEHAGNPAVASRMDLRSRAGEPCAAREPLLTGQEEQLRSQQQEAGAAAVAATTVGNKPELIQRIPESGRMICAEKCRLVLAQQACRGVRLPIEFLVNEHRADAWIEQVRS